MYKMRIQKPEKIQFNSYKTYQRGMDEVRKIVIDWSYPMDIDSILNDERMDEIGIYYITRNFGGRISDLYIGKTIYSYKSRLVSHRWYWLDNYRGKKYVRLGTIVKPKCISDRKSVV